MDDLTNRSIETFLDDTAKRAPTPGGGAIAALTGALGAALARMVTAYSVGKDTPPETRSAVEAPAIKLHRADELMRAFVTQDAKAYADMTAARKAARLDPEKLAAYQQSVLTAVSVPMEIAGVASSALTAMEELKSVANRYLLSDLGAAAVIAHAASEAARFMVAVNLPELSDQDVRRKLLDEINETVEHCRQRREAVERFVNDALEPA